MIIYIGYIIVGMGLGMFISNCSNSKRIKYAESIIDSFENILQWSFLSNNDIVDFDRKEIKEYKIKYGFKGMRKRIK